MSRRLRFIPEGGALVEVTCCALHSRLLFRPGPTMNEIILGALARRFWKATGSTAPRSTPPAVAARTTAGRPRCRAIRWACSIHGLFLLTVRRL